MTGDAYKTGSSGSPWLSPECFPGRTPPYGVQRLFISLIAVFGAVAVCGIGLTIYTQNGERVFQLFSYAQATENLHAQSFPPVVRWRREVPQVIVGNLTVKWDQEPRLIVGWQGEIDLDAAKAGLLRQLP